MTLISTVFGPFYLSLILPYFLFWVPTGFTYKDGLLWYYYNHSLARSAMLHVTGDNRRSKSAEKRQQRMHTGQRGSWQYFFCLRVEWTLQEQ